MFLGCIVSVVFAWKLEIFYYFFFEITVQWILPRSKAPAFCGVCFSLTIFISVCCLCVSWKLNCSHLALIWKIKHILSNVGACMTCVTSSVYSNLGCKSNIFVQIFVINSFFENGILLKRFVILLTMDALIASKFSIFYVMI